MKFKSDIEVQAGLRDGSDDIGTAGQLLSSTGTITNWIDQGAIAAESAEVVEVPVKNVHTATILKGTPVYIFGSIGSSGRLEVKPADAGVAGSMPALGLLKQDLAVNAEGFCVISGKLRNLITSPIDGVTTNDGDVVYVKAGGGLTTTKPTGSANLIQNMGKVGVSSTSNNGTFVVSSILRSNDVPNLTTGKIWVGSAANTIESATVHLDETNGRMGIGTTSPTQKLEVNGNIEATAFMTSGVSYSRFINDAYIHASSGNDIVLGGGIGGFQNDVVISGGVIKASSTGNHYFVNSNVGIGTSSPTQTLDVDGNILFGVVNKFQSSTNTLSGLGSNGVLLRSAISTAANPSFSNSDDTNTGMFLPGADVLGLSTGGAERLRITSGGSIGIGTTSPAAQLEINDASAPFMRFGRATSYWWEIGHTASDFQFNSATGGTIMHLEYDGKVGIGTTTPDSKLQVDGGIQMADDTDAASASKVGTLRYRTSGNNSYVDMCMQTGASTYEWVNIVQNNW